MFKIKLAILLPFIFLLSCNDDDSDDFVDPYGPGGYTCPDIGDNFRILDIISTNLDTELNVYGGDPLEELDSVNFDDFEVLFEFETEFFTQKEAKLLKEESIDLSCAGAGFKGDVIGVSNINVLTKFDYNSFSAGDNINSIIGIKSFDDFANIQEYIDENKNGVLFDQFELKLSESPLLPDTSFALEIDYVLNNGEEFNVTTETIILE